MPQKQPSIVLIHGLWMTPLAWEHWTTRYQERGFTVSINPPEQFPIQPATLSDLLGGDRFENAEIVRRILLGGERGPKRDAVLLNASAALFIAGKVKTLIEGWELAEQTIDSRAAEKKLAELSA